MNLGMITEVDMLPNLITIGFSAIQIPKSFSESMNPWTIMIRLKTLKISHG